MSEQPALMPWFVQVYTGFAHEELSRRQKPCLWPTTRACPL
jgi:hypothetical protein